jgi:hypothetical protein
MSDVSQIAVAGGKGNINKPASGTYGEGAALSRLKQSLPSTPGGPSQPTGPATAPTAPPPPPPMAPQPPGESGLPAALLRPTDRPNVPINTPLQPYPQNPVAAAQTPKQANLALLLAMAESDEVSEATKEWAKSVLAALGIQ